MHSRRVWLMAVFAFHDLCPLCKLYWLVFFVLSSKKDTTQKLHQLRLHGIVYFIIFPPLSLSAVINQRTDHASQTRWYSHQWSQWSRKGRRATHLYCPVEHGNLLYREYTSSETCLTLLFLWAAPVVSKPGGNGVMEILGGIKKFTGNYC